MVVFAGRHVGGTFDQLEVFVIQWHRIVALAAVWALHSPGDQTHIPAGEGLRAGECHAASDRAYIRSSASGLCTASPPLFSLRTRYCGSSDDARTVRPQASVSEVIFLITSPSASPPWLLQRTLSPFLNSNMSGRYPPPDPRNVTRTPEPGKDEDARAQGGRLCTSPSDSASEGRRAGQPLALLADELGSRRVQMTGYRVGRQVCPGFRRQ